MNPQFSALNRIYNTKKRVIKNRLKEFRQLWKNQNSEDVFAELVFCILTPQSKARICWDAVSRLKKRNLLRKAQSASSVLCQLKGVRFKYKKAKYICLAKRLFTSGGRIAVLRRLKEFSGPFEARGWLAQNVKGLGYKEASHFLRNIGLGESLAILDRHILKNLKRLGVISEIPDSLSRKKYFEIEEKMVKFADRVNIPASELDLVFWYNETGDIFK